MHAEHLIMHTSNLPLLLHYHGIAHSLHLPNLPNRPINNRPPPILPPNSLPPQKHLLLPLTLPQIHKHPQRYRRNNTKTKQKVKRRRIIPIRRSLDDSRGDEGPDKGGCLADDAEEGEEEEFVSPGGYF